MRFDDKDTNDDDDVPEDAQVIRGDSDQVKALMDHVDRKLGEEITSVLMGKDIVVCCSTLAVLLAMGIINGQKVQSQKEAIEIRNRAATYAAFLLQNVQLIVENQDKIAGEEDNGTGGQESTNSRTLN